MTYSWKEPLKINEFQKNQITKKLTLDFYKELNSFTKEKKRYSKIFREQIDILISKLHNQGIMFYGFTIDMPFLRENEKSNTVWKEVHDITERFLNYMGCHVELIEFCYLSIEVNGIKPEWYIQTPPTKIIEKETFGLPRIYGIFGVRSLIGENANLLYDLIDVFLMSFFDIKLEWLNKPDQIKNYWNFIIKQNNFKFHRFVNYSNFYPMIYGAIADEELKFENCSAFGQENHFISETMYISGVKERKPSSKVLLVYLLNVYLINKNYRIHENKIFVKVENFYFSWKIFCTLEQLKKNYKLIFEELKELYPQQLSDFNINEITLTNLDLVFSKIKKNNSFIPEINIFDDIIEFNDGIYFLSKNLFLLKNKELQDKKLNTLLYIDDTFSSLKFNDILIKSIYKTIDKNLFYNLICFFRNELKLIKDDKDQK